MSWSFAKVWNDSLELGRPERVLKPRTNIWAGEVGGSYIDRYLKMNGVEPTNPPNPRSKRKFEAGNMMEWIVQTVLKRAGILLDTQEWLSYQYDGLLEVTGKLDFLAGGKPDWERASKAVKELELPEFFGRATSKIIDYLKEQYPDGLDTMVLECKSCSSFMFERYEKFGADPRHQAQIFHYLKSKNLPEGHIIYISKDDLRLLELPVYNPSEIEEFYRKDIENMTRFIVEKVRPSLEKPVLFENFKFTSNFKLGYSNYLTMLYDYKDQFSFDEVWKGEVSKWNRVYQRSIKGEKITTKNEEIITRIKEQFSNYDELVDLGKINLDKIELETEDIND